MKNLLTGFLAVLLVILLASPAAALPKDKYPPKSKPVSERNFKKTITKWKRAWVMFEDSNPKVPPRIHNQGNKFWKVLKARFGNQVEAFIRIDTRGWPDAARTARKEIIHNEYPSFVLYEKGVVVNEGTSFAIIINGAPMSQQIEPIFRYITSNSDLK